MEQTYTVQRDIVIAAPAATIYESVVDFHRWEGWSPWEDTGANMARTYGGADSGVGATYSWQGNRKVGEGTMKIVGAEDGAEVRIDLEFVKPFKARNDIVFTLAPADDGTRVTWAMTGRKTFMARVMSIFWSMDKAVGRDFEKGLARLKAVAESSDV